jgi:hypothetical protein
MYKCKVEWCTTKAHLKGYCRPHLNALETYGDPYKTQPRKPSKKKKLDYFISDKGCFECTSHSGRSNYPTVSYYGKQIDAHRFVYEQMYGDIPEGLVVRHKCDNPKCINPEHMELGTIADNNRDIWDRGRENVTSRSFNEEQLSDILERLAKGEKQTDIAKGYGVSTSTINHIKTRRNYKRILELMEK